MLRIGEEKCFGVGNGWDGICGIWYDTLVFE